MEKHKTFSKIDLIASKKTFSRKFAYEGRLFYLDRSAKFYFDKEYNYYGRTKDFGDDFYKLLNGEIGFRARFVVETEDEFGFVFVNLENSFIGLSKIYCKLSISWHNSQCTDASSFFPAE